MMKLYPLMLYIVFMKIRSIYVYPHVYLIILIFIYKIIGYIVYNEALSVILNLSEYISLYIICLEYFYFNLRLQIKHIFIKIYDLEFMTSYKNSNLHTVCV